MHKQFEFTWTKKPRIERCRDDDGIMKDFDFGSKVYAEGTSWIDPIVWDEYKKLGHLSILHIELMRPTGKLPGLSTAFTPLALWMKIGKEELKFPLGAFDRYAPSN